MTYMIEGLSVASHTILSISLEVMNYWLYFMDREIETQES